ncbi:MAG: hypothetical protein ACTSVF_00640 [Candidatus Asgardarchaeia archaeon]
MQGFIVFSESYLLLSKKVRFLVVDKFIDKFWKANEKCEMRWDVEQTGNNIYFRLYPDMRPTDERAFLALMSKIMEESKSLLNMLRSKDPTFFPNYTSLSTFLRSLSTMSEALLSYYTDDRLDNMPSTKRVVLNNFLKKDLKEMGWEERIKVLKEELGVKMRKCIEFIRKTTSSIPVVEYYLSEDFKEYPEGWVEKLNFLKKYDQFPIFISVPREEYFEKIVSVFPKSCYLTRPQLDLYKDIITMARLQEKNVFNFLDIMRYKYGYNIYPTIEISIRTKLRQLSEIGLIEVVGEDSYALIE